MWICECNNYVKIKAWNNANWNARCNSTKKKGHQKHNSPPFCVLHINIDLKGTDDFGPVKLTMRLCRSVLTVIATQTMEIRLIPANHEHGICSNSMPTELLGTHNYRSAQLQVLQKKNIFQLVQPQKKFFGSGDHWHGLLVSTSPHLHRFVVIINLQDVL